MKYLVLGGSGFLGHNLCNALLKDENNIIIVFDKKESNIFEMGNVKHDNLCFVKGNFDEMINFEQLVVGCDVVFHLVSSTTPGTKENNFCKEIKFNIFPTILLLDACVKYKCKFIFISSGGTVYGQSQIKLKEDAPTNPICHYGVQKLMIEKYLLLYNHLYGLNCKIIRLSNPYGPHQIPNAGQGALTTFVYNTLFDKEISIMGDGSVIRDYIYVDDAINGIINISNYDGIYNVINLGSGEGKSLIQIIHAIEKNLEKKCKVNFGLQRNIDVPYNILDIERYKCLFGKGPNVSLDDGIKKLASYFIDDKKIKNKMFY